MKMVTVGKAKKQFGFYGDYVITRDLSHYDTLIGNIQSNSKGYEVEFYYGRKETAIFKTLKEAVTFAEDRWWCNN